jgi:outer membrane immunogenic protein
MLFAACAVATIYSGLALADGNSEDAERWSGTHLGVTIGGQFPRDRWITDQIGNPGIGLDATALTNLDRSSLRLGGYIGYDYMNTSDVLVGLEGDFAADTASRSSSAGIPGDITNENAAIADGFAVAPIADRVRFEGPWDGSVRARIGVLATGPQVLLYVTGGAAFQGTKYSVSCPGFDANGNGTTASACVFPESGSKSATRTGWTIGAGLERNICDDWVVRAEFRISEFGREDLSYFQASPLNGIDLVKAHADLETEVLSVGVAYRL